MSEKIVEKIMEENVRIKKPRCDYVERLDKYVELCKQGLSYNEIRKITGWTQKSLRRYTKATGVASPLDPKEIKRKRLKKIKMLYDSGVPLPTIATMFNSSLRTVHTYLQELRHEHPGEYKLRKSTPPVISYIYKAKNLDKLKLMLESLAGEFK